MSPLCDRTKQGVTKSQVGFFEFVVLPLFNNYCHRFTPAKPLLKAVTKNYRFWVEEAKRAEVYGRASTTIADATQPSQPEPAARGAGPGSAQDTLVRVSLMKPSVGEDGLVSTRGSSQLAAAAAAAPTAEMDGPGSALMAIARRVGRLSTTDAAPAAPPAAEPVQLEGK